MPFSRREVLALSSLALLERCTRRQEPMSYESRLHARPAMFERATTVPAGLRPLGLAKDRDGSVYVPRPDASSLVVYLHGAGGSGARAMQRLTEHADRTGAIVLAPDSRETTWGFSGTEEAADLAFLDDALETIFTGYRIDPRRIGISGFSDGASMALSWGLMNGDLFPNIAAFSPGFIQLSAPAMGSPRVFISHGTRDSILPVERCGRRIARELQQAGYAVDYREFDGEHTVPEEIRRVGFEALVG